MSPQPIAKASFDDFYKSCSHFLIMPELESQMKRRVEGIMQQIISFSSDNGGQNNLRDFLQNEKDFLGIMLSMAGMPQEKFLRILSAERFTHGDYGTEWSIGKVYKKIREDNAFADKVASLLLEERNNELLAKKVASFYLNQLSLSEDWQSSLQDTSYIERIVRHKLTGEYNDLKGKHYEQKINNALNVAGIPHEKGQVALVRKEVDHVVPSISDRQILIMTAYHETTSSSQTARANEQIDMYSKITEENNRYPNRAPMIFINIVDGGGWLARRSDLKKLHSSCDYCLNMSMLGQLPTIVSQHWQGKQQ